jgi:hypothetical protein
VDVEWIGGGYLKVVRVVKGRTEEEDVAGSRMVVLVVGGIMGHDVAGERI